MFDIGLSEILLILVIALVVLGPDKLPKLAADIGRWVGRARSMARQLSAQLEQEVRLDEAVRAQRRDAEAQAGPAQAPPAATPVSPMPSTPLPTTTVPDDTSAPPLGAVAQIPPPVTPAPTVDGHS